MTLAELRAFIRRQAREVFASEVSDAQLDMLLNEGYQDFAARSGALKRDITVTVNANSQIVNLPSYVVNFLGITQGTSKLLEATPQDLEVIYGIGWRSQTGTPKYYVRLSPTAVQPVPVPITNQTWIVEAVVIPSNASSAPVPLLSNDTDSPQLPEHAHIALAYYAIFQMSMMNPQNQLLAARAQTYWAQYLELVEQVRLTQGQALRGAVLRPTAQMQQQGR